MKVWKERDTKERDTKERDTKERDTKTKNEIHLSQIKVAETFCGSFLVSVVHVTR